MQQDLWVQDVEPCGHYMDADHLHLLFTVPAHVMGNYVSALSWTVLYHLKNAFLYVHIW
jgi:hypothetical protein